MRSDFVDTKVGLVTILEVCSAENQTESSTVFKYPLIPIYTKNFIAIQEGIGSDGIFRGVGEKGSASQTN